VSLLRDWKAKAEALARERLECVPRSESNGQPLLVPFVHEPDLIGRNQFLAKMHTQMDGPLAVYGQGGVGKTQLAVKYVYQYCGDHPQGILWLDASDSQSIVTQLEDIAEQLRIPDTGGAEHNRTRRRALHVVGWLRERPDALLVLDNLDDDGWLRQSIPGLRHVRLLGLARRVLITTRLQRLPGVPNALFLDRLLPEDALALLQREADRPPEQSGNIICAQLGCIPLALRLAGSLAREENLSFADLSNQLRQRGIEPVLNTQAVPGDYRPDVDKAAMQLMIGTSWELVKQSHPAAANLLLLLGGMPLNRLVRREWMVWVTPPVYLETQVQVMPWVPELRALVERTMSLLHNRSLLEAIGNRQVRLHPMIHDYLQPKLVTGMMKGLHRRASVTLRTPEFFRGAEVVDWHALLHDLPMILPYAADADTALTGFYRCLELQSRALSTEWDVHNQMHLQAKRLGDDELADAIEAGHERSPRLHQRWTTETPDPAFVRHLAFQADALVRDVAFSGNGRVAAMIRMSKDETPSTEGENPAYVSYAEMHPDQGREWELEENGGHENPVQCAVSYDGNRLATLSSNGVVTLWDCATGVSIYAINPPEELPDRMIPGRFGFAFSMNNAGTHAVAAFGDPLEHEAHLWRCDLTTGCASYVLAWDDVVVELALTDSGRCMGFRDRAGGAYLLHIERNETPIKLILRDEKDQHFAEDLSFDKNGEYGYVRFSESTLVRFSLVNGEVMDRWDLLGRPYACCVKGTYALLGFYDGDCHLLDFTTGEDAAFIIDSDGSITGCWLSADGQKAITQTDSSIRLWNLVDARKDWSPEKNLDAIIDCSYADFEEKIVAITLHGELLWMDPSSGRVVKRDRLLHEGCTVQVTKDCLISSITDDQGQVSLCIQELTGPNTIGDPCYLLLPALHDPDDPRERVEYGRVGFFATADYQQLLWFDADSHEEGARLVFEEDQLVDFTVASNAAVGAYCAHAADEDCVPENGVDEPPGTKDMFGDRELVIWTPQQGPTYRYRFSYDEAPSGLLLSSDGKTLIIGTHEGALLVWRPEELAAPKQLLTGEMDFMPLDFSQDDRFLLVVEGGTRVLVYDLVRKQVLARLLLGGIEAGRFAGADRVFLAGRGGISFFELVQ
jgi:WD40 repeat protein